MSIGPMPAVVASIAGQNLAQAASDTPRAQHAESQQSRAAESIAKADEAAGIGHTEAEEGASDRDADGRRPWEIAAARRAAESASDAEGEVKSRDASGQCGTQIDLTG